jgi:hypothetical protein
VGLLVFGLAALPFDKRTILGLNPWIKPLKFDVSALIYLATIAVLLELLPDRTSGRRAIGWIVGLSLIFEDGIISLQSLRGVRSHMNFATREDALLFAAMGVLILINTIAVAWLTALYFKAQAHLAPALLWGVRLGLLVFLAGSAEGVAIVWHMGHTVGAADGGAGLPFLNWSRDHGDLRVPHFLALHALQLLPLMGWAVGRTGWRRGLQVATVSALFTAYAVAVWVLFREAMAGRPLI